MTLKAGRLGIGTSEPKAALDVRGDIYRNGVPAFPIPTAHFYKQDSSTTNTNHFQNIKSGWVAFTHAPVTIPGVIESFTLNGGTGSTTDNTASGLVVKLCKEGLYKIQTSFSIMTQSGINSHIGINIRAVGTSYIAANTGTDYANGLGGGDGYDLHLADYNVHEKKIQHEFIRVTKAPGYAYVTMTPNSNNADHFKMTHYGVNAYGIMNVMYLG
jgi:hypothetical protein